MSECYVNNHIVKTSHCFRIQSLQGIGHLPHLRVLLAGNNRLRTMEHVAPLSELDVLDLQMNQIEEMGTSTS